MIPSISSLCARRLAGTAALVLAAPLGAQEPLGTPAPPPAPDRDCVCAWELSELPRIAGAFQFNRARIGVELGEAAAVGARTGVRLRSVVEGGPAERAGLREGDILLTLDGTPLGDAPADRLIDLMGGVEPGDTVAIGYHRNGRDATARVVTERAGALSVFRHRGPEVDWARPRMGPGRIAALAPDMRVMVRDLLGEGLELVPMNEQLGSYFNVTEGVLVTSVDEDSALGLRAGDVILTIGGRAVRDPEHVRSILASYRPDETIPFEVVRERRRATVSGTKAR